MLIFIWYILWISRLKKKTLNAVVVFVQRKKLRMLHVCLRASKIDTRNGEQWFGKTAHFVANANQRWFCHANYYGFAERSGCWTMCPRVRTLASPGSFGHGVEIPISEYLAGRSWQFRTRIRRAHCATRYTRYALRQLIAPSFNHSYNCNYNKGGINAYITNSSCFFCKQDNKSFVSWCWLAFSLSATVASSVQSKARKVPRKAIDWS